MRLPGWLWIVLPACVLTAPVLAQSPADSQEPHDSRSSLRVLDFQQGAGMLRLPPPAEPALTTGETLATDATADSMSPDAVASFERILDSVVELDSEDVAEEEVFLPRSLDEFIGYRYGESSLDWMVGAGDQFGRFSLIGGPYVARGEKSGVHTGVQIHFLGGPARTEMPPRVFDFSIGFQSRKRLGSFAYDVSASVMASSDFKGNCHQGIRYPSHAVGFLRMNTTTELAFGVDYLDRGHIKLLPVGGLVFVPNPDMRFEIVFPRPRAVFRLTDEHHLFIRGELGGHSWAVRRYGMMNDLANYRDLQLAVGVETLDRNGGSSIFEIAYLFSRELDFSSSLGDYALDDTAMLRLVHVF